MHQIQLTVDRDQLQGLLTHDEALRQLLESLLNQVLQAEVTDYLQAQPYERTEQALVVTLMEMVVNGVSTRKVLRITEDLCGMGFSKSTSLLKKGSVLARLQ